MASYKLTNKAVADLSGIWDYTFDNWSEKLADTYYDMLLDCYQDIANNPELGKNYAGIKSDLFGFKASRHIFFFYRKSTEKPIEITRITIRTYGFKKRIIE